MVSLVDIHAGLGKPSRNRVGRGPGSGNGKTSGRGNNGAGSRSGYKSRRGSEGGQKALFRRVAKRGFNPTGGQTDTLVIQSRYLISKADQSGVVTVSERLLEKGVRVKIVGQEVPTAALKVFAHSFSAAAAAAIQSAGGQAIRIL